MTNDVIDKIMKRKKGGQLVGRPWRHDCRTSTVVNFPALTAHITVIREAPGGARYHHLFCFRVGAHILHCRKLKLHAVYLA